MDSEVGRNEKTKQNKRRQPKCRRFGDRFLFLRVLALRLGGPSSKEQQLDWLRCFFFLLADARKQQKQQQQRKRVRCCLDFSCFFLNSFLLYERSLGGRPVDENDSKLGRQT